ncbi:P-loop containing nucleoside triphosphate hydrolase protein [Pyrenochaeta sp. MPI-SDFR-AT-0127]|nr:P-loop containing nucleoside triphosphate hydrolase protein [Pyrenochaeta sp. MPI-SDFR-AT-0127]
MATTPAPSKDLAVPQTAVADERQLWPEPLDTPGYIPRHMKRSATASFPILEVVQRILYRLRSSANGGDLEKILALIGLYQAVRPVYYHLKEFCVWAFTVQVTIPESDPVAKEVLAWMGSNVILNSRTRSAMLVTGGLQDPNDDFHRRMMLSRGPIMGSQRVDDEVLCLPPIGTRLFWVGYRPFVFSRRGGHSYRNNSVMAGNLVDDSGQLQNSLTLVTLGWSLKPLQTFTELCHQFKLDNLTGTTTVYFAGGAHGDPYGDGWQSVSKAIRKLDTIDMDEVIKSDLIRDAEYYYSEQSRQFFADCGIPYRRGYLFYGPPGTGKSSFSAALAGHLGCDIYHINLATGDISDGRLHRLFLGLPRKCIVVIEDIDSAGIGREQGPSTKPEPDPLLHPDILNNLPPPPPKSYEERRRNMVTLSGLLNAIDGNASQEGRLLIMTSNNPDALDAALTRPGRIDKKVYFGNMSKSAGKSIFKRLIGRSALAHDAAFTMAQIEQYANDFADKVPANTFTPAQVQNFLQGCRGDPHKALEEISGWVEENRVGAETVSAARTSDTSASFVEHTESDVDSVTLAEDTE